MSSPRGDSYQAEVLRWLHDEHRGILVDQEVGISRRVWEALGQKAGKNFPTVCAVLSALEDRGCVLTEFGSQPRKGGRMRVSVMVVEEPPEGTTVYRERRAYSSAVDPDQPTDTSRFPTPEEVAQELLRLTIEASQVPVTDIRAAHHHISCLQEEIAGYIEMVEDLENANPERERRLIELLRRSRQQTHVQRELFHVQRAHTDTANREIVKANARVHELEEVAAELNRQIDAIIETNERLADTAKEQERTILILREAVTRQGDNILNLPGEEKYKQQLRELVENMTTVGFRKTRVIEV